MMRNKKGFTIVELVIVIAVIAILAAVLIPTFGSIIDNANNSADVQLAAHLNVAIADAKYEPNTLATAQNIRNHVRPFGYEAEDIVTKNKNNVIVYNSETKQIEVLSIKNIDAKKLVEDAITGNGVFENKIVISTGGNGFSEALYDIENMQPEESISALSIAMAAAVDPPQKAQLVSEYVTNALNKIENTNLRIAVAGIVSSTIYVTNNGEMYIVDIENDTNGRNNLKATAYKIVKENIEEWIEEGDYQRDRVIFSNDVESFDAKDVMVGKGEYLSVVVPNHVTLTNSSDSTDDNYYQDKPRFYGNVDSSVIPSSNIDTIDNLTNAIEGGVNKLYLAMNQVYTEDCGGLAEAVELAEKIQDTKKDYKENYNSDYNTSVRIILNANTTLSQNITIREGITLEIPFGVGNFEAAEIMSSVGGDFLSDRALGDAFPANDKASKNEYGEIYGEEGARFYLCGEGPGNGLSGTGATTDNPVFAASRNITEKSAAYTLTIAKGCTLTINGKVRIGGIIGYNDASGYQGHTSGAYGQITNNGSIVVEDGGVLDVWGFIKGSGEVVANESGLVYEPFVVADYLDTIPTLMLYPFLGDHDAWEKVYNSPFMRFSVMNIQTECAINYGAALYGRANLVVFMGMAYARADAPLVTSDGYYLDPEDEVYKALNPNQLPDNYKWDAENRKLMQLDDWGDELMLIPVDGAFRITENAQLISTYTDHGVKIEKAEDGNLNCEDYEYYDNDYPAKYGPIDNIANIASLSGDIGVLNITIKGTVFTGGIQMDLLGNKLPGLTEVIDTSYCTLPISYNYNITVANGANLILGKGNKYALMPGAEFTVENGGTLTIEEDAALYVMDAMDSSEFFRSIVEVMMGEDAVPSDDGLMYGPDVNVIIITLPLTMVRKYYPSAKLLKANGFEASAKFTLNGTLYVNNGAAIGGIVNAGEGAQLKLKEGAILGGFVNLGGYLDPYMLSMLGDDPSNLALMFLTMTIQPCFLRIVDSDGKLFDYSDCYTSNTLSDVENLVSAFFGEMAQMITVDESVQEVYDSSIEVYRVANGDYTLTLGSASENAYELKDANVAYIAPLYGIITDEEEDPIYELVGLTLKASTVQVNTKYYGGSWDIKKGIEA